MRVVGIDPGSYSTGFGVVEMDGNRYLRCRCGLVTGKKGSTIDERLAEIYSGIKAILQREHPDAVAVETPFYAKSVKSTLILAHVRGVVLLAVRQEKIALYEYAPREVKRAVVGNGAASKEQIQYMVRRLLALSKDPDPDAADALAVAICHHHRSRSAVLSK